MPQQKPKKGGVVAAAPVPVDRDQMVLKLAAAKNEVIGRFNSIETAAAEKIGEIEFLDQQVEARKVQLVEFDVAVENAQAIEDLATRKLAAEADFRIYQADLAAQRSREAAEYKYNLERERKIERERHEDEIRERSRKETEAKAVSERILQQQRDDLAEREAEVERREEEVEDRMIAAEGRVEAAVSAALADQALRAKYEKDEELSDLRKQVDLLNADAEAYSQMESHLRSDLKAAQETIVALQGKLGEIALSSVNATATEKAARGLMAEFAATQFPTSSKR